MAEYLKIKDVAAPLRVRNILKYRGSPTTRNNKIVAIIGAGPAGIATAIQLKRYGIEPIIIEKKEIGGLLRNANLVENYPGFPEGIKGTNLVNLFKKHLKANDIKVNFEEVMAVDYHKNRFNIKTNKRKFTCQILVIAPGTEPEKLSIRVPENCANRILSEVHPIQNITNKKIAIIGNGDAAFDYALSLSSKNKVAIFNRSDKTKCLPVLWKRAQTEIEYCEKTVVRKITKKDDGLLLVLNHKKEPIYVDYLVVAIGRKPRLNFLSEHLKKRIKDLVKKKILYIIGDAKNGIYRQTAIAVGDGVRTAMKIALKSKKVASREL